jgi:hypothetical protein
MISSSASLSFVNLAISFSRLLASFWSCVFLSMIPVVSLKRLATFFES